MRRGRVVRGRGTGREIVAAVREGEYLRFGLGPIELEFHLEVSRKAGGQAGIAFCSSPSGQWQSHVGTTHKVKLVITAVGNVGEKLK